MQIWDQHLLGRVVMGISDVGDWATGGDWNIGWDIGGDCDIGGDDL